MTRNYLPSGSSSVKTSSTEMESQRKSSDAVSPSILTTSEILKSHEDAQEIRRHSHDGELNLPQSVITAMEVIGSAANIRAQRLAANLAALEAKTTAASSHNVRPNTTRNTLSEQEIRTIENLSLAPPVPQVTSKEARSALPHPEPGVLSYRKSAFDKSSSGAGKHKHPGTVIGSVFAHGDAKYDDINTQIISSIRQAHPGSRLIPVDLWNLDLYGFSFAGHAQLEMVTSVIEGTGISAFFYAPPPKRTGFQGAIGQQPEFEAGVITYKGAKWTIYFATWAKGFNVFKRGYIVHEGDITGDSLVEQFILDCGLWTSTPKEQIWVYDDGFWQLDGALYASIMKADWKDIILPDELKEDVLNDVLGFYAAEETYRGLKMPWKRGIVFYGPPGNGKTITLKAIMKALYTPTPDIPALPLPSLYVKTLAGWGPPEFAIRDVFMKAREQAPCFLIWEDLDSIIDDSNRSFFLNELDGLEDNNGLLVIGTTNHLDRLDPGIIKRPSRFDRKYLFDNPAIAEREKYVEYWRNKLADTPIDFTDALVKELADLMKDFSFAYMKEAFVSTLLVLAGGRNNKDGGDEWASKFEATIKKQIKQLREQLEAQ
ncbi:Paraplegin [Dactylella cylindrospora]|nr:Paraplegin [Dactylella cylindrospora]